MNTTDDALRETLRRRLSSFVACGGMYNTSADLADLLLEVVRSVIRDELRGESILSEQRGK